MNEWLRVWWLPLLLAVSSSSSGMELSAVPNPRAAGTGWVSDSTGKMRSEDRQAIDRGASSLAAATGRQLFTVLVRATDGRAPKPFATALFNLWGIGDRVTNDGVLFLIVLDSRRTEVEIGRGLEGRLTRAQIESLLADDVVPLFKQGDISGGARAGALALAARLRELPVSPARPAPAPVASAPVARAPVRPAAEEPSGSALRMLTFNSPYTLPWAMGSSILLAVLGLLLIHFAAHPFPRRGEELAGLAGLLAGALSVAVACVCRWNSAPPVVALCGALGLVTVFAALPCSGFFRRESLSATHARFALGAQALAVLGAVGALASLKETPEVRPLLGIYYRDVFPWAFVGFAAFAAGWFGIRKILRFIPPSCAGCRLPMTLVPRNESQKHLDPGQAKESSLGSTEYDVWDCSGCGAKLTKRFARRFSGFAACPVCKYVTAKVEEATIVSATTYNSGLGRRTRSCRNCGDVSISEYTISQLADSSSSNSSSSGSSSSSSSSSSSDSGGGSSSGSDGGGASW